jgi:hypothetical protein
MAKAVELLHVYDLPNAGFRDERLPARIEPVASFTTLLGQNRVVLTKNSRKQDIKVVNTTIESKNDLGPIRGQMSVGGATSRVRRGCRSDVRRQSGHLLGASVRPNRNEGLGNSPNGPSIGRSDVVGRSITFKMAHAARSALRSAVRNFMVGHRNCMPA